MKRKLGTRIAAVVLALVTSLTLGSCGTKYDIAMSHPSGLQITENMYNYWLCYYKTTILQNYGLSEDYADLWSSMSDDKTSTLGVLFGKQVTEMVKTMLASAVLLKEYGQTLSSEDKKQIDENIADSIEAYGSKSAFNEELAKYGVNTKILKDIFTLDAQYSMLADYLYNSETGTSKPTNDELMKYFLENFVYVKHILINTVNPQDPTEAPESTEAPADESGTTETGAEDTATTESATEATTAEETTQDTTEGTTRPVEVIIEERKALVEDLKKRIDAGESFEELMGEYTEDTGITTYPDGYVFTKGDFQPEFEEAAYDMKPGEVRIIETTYGTHILKKYEMDSSKFEENKDTVTYNWQLKSFEALVKPILDEITVNEDIIAAFDIATANTMFGEQTAAQQ
ncbi:MAG: peptidylprolyl isomerase [Eubacteriales bacterium]